MAIRSPRPVHPRACGEQAIVSFTVTLCCGSSPRMRGTVVDDPFQFDAARFIPAHAGNRLTPSSLLLTRPVHPRACGEQSGAHSAYIAAAGSSPRMRGTVAPRAGDGCGSRFIPAHAGNRRYAQTRYRGPTVHPRACGEQVFVGIAHAFRHGSSPRMRGTDQKARYPGDRGRFIPAHAGNRQVTHCAPRPTPVHPRACGEQALVVGPNCGFFGSSPRMRGTVALLCRSLTFARFIPAHAGNRCRRRTCPFGDPVHPRACGEQSTGGFMRADADGSSPRMRGTGQARSISHDKPRFIPAHAGNRGRRGGRMIPADGSSPRMRGTGFERCSPSRQVRFIPAHAGNRDQAVRRTHRTTVHPRACGEQLIAPGLGFSQVGSSPRMRGTERHRR